MAWVVVAWHGGGGAARCSALLASVGARVASIHGSPSCNEKWDNKWKSVTLLLSPPC
jgi:hypothetical protein